MGLFDDIIQEHGSSPGVTDEAEAALKGSIFDDSENRPQREAIYLPGKPTLGSEIPHRRQEIAEPEPVASTRTDDSDFYRGVKTTLQQLPQLGYGLLAGLGAVAESAQGEEGGLAGKIKEVGLAGYQDWGDRIQVNAKPSDSFTHSWERAKQGDYGALLDWAQHALGYSVGQTAQMLTGAGLAKLGAQAVLQTGAKRLVGGMVKKEVGKLIAKQAASKTATALGKKELTALATKNVARKIGERAFLATTAFGMEGGEIMGDLAAEATRRGELLSGEEIAKGLAATAGAGSLEYISDKFGLDVLMGKSKLLKMANQVTGKKGRVARAAIAGVGMGGTEQATEYAQTGLEQYGKGQALNTEAAATERRDAGMQALLGSGLIGAGRGAITAPVAKIQPQDKDINVFEFLDEQGDKHDLSRMPDAGLQTRQEVQELRNEDAEVISPDSTAADIVQGPSAAAQSTIAVPGMETYAPQQNAPSEQDSFEIPLPEEPLLPDTEMAAHAAATSPLNDLPEPSLAQKQKGNYKKGHRRILGLDISIENPAGSERSGVDPDGMPWSQTMMNHYGYIKGTTGKDKDHLDVFLGPGADQLGNGVEQVAVIDQIDPQSGRFDEHKIILGVTDAFEAQSVYLPNYDETGPQRIGAITMMSAAQFKDWLKGNTKKPVAYVPTEKETQTVSSLQEPGKQGPAVQEPIQPAAEEGLAESSSQAPKVTNLYSGIPLSELKKLGGNLRKAMPHLVALGQQVYQSGAQTLDAFKQAMKQALGNLYQRFKDGMIQVFQKVKALAKDQRGSFSMKPDTAYLLSQAKQDLKAGTTTPERLQSLRDAYKALPDGDLKAQLKEVGKQYRRAVETIQQPAEKPAQQPSASQPTRKLSQKEQAFKDWQVLEEVAPQDISEDELKKLRDKRYAQILNEGRTGIPADNETDVTLDMEKADSEVYEPTNWGRSVNAAMLDEMKGYDETTTFAHRVEQDRKTRAFNKIRRLQDLPKDMHDKTPSEAELERINTEARKENERVLQRVYQNMGSNPKLAEGKPSLRDVIANELKWLGETYLLRDIIDYIKREEKVSSLSRLTEYPDALFDFISHHESLSEAQPLSSEEATAETPGLRFVQRVIHALNPRLLREVKRLKDDTGLEAKRLFESFQRGEKGLFPEREYRKIQPIIALMFRQPQKLVDFARQYGADLERFSSEFGKTVNNRFQEAYITPKLLNAIVTAANAEDYVFDEGLPDYDSLINAEAKEQADQRKTAIPRRKVPAVKEPKLNRAKLRRQWLTAQYRNFKKRFAGEYDSLIAENWLAFFQAVRELATTGSKTAANQLNISTIATKMRYAKGLHNRSTEAFKSLPDEVREQVVARMLEHSKLNRPWRKYKNRPAYRGEGVVTQAMLDEAEKSGTPLDLKVGDPLPSGFPVAEIIDQNKESTQLGEEVFVEPADAVWSDERFGIDDTPGQLDMVKTDDEGNLLRFEQANDIEFLLGELMMSSAGEAVAQQRGYPDLETYHKYLVRKFTQGWPKITPANPTKAYYARRDAIRDDIYRELPFARAALLTQQFQQDRIFSVDAFDEMARQYRQQAQPWIDQLAVNARKNHRLNAAELYNIFVSTGSLSAVTNEINRRIHEVRQLVADTNHAELSHEDTQRKAARKIARTHLTEKQQKLFDQLAKKLKNGQFTNEANAIWQEIKLPADRAALDAAFQIEQDLIDGKIDIADVKVDHGIQVFPEDIFQALDRQAEVARLQKERDALAQQEKEARLKKDTAKIAELVAAQKQTVIDQRLVDVLTVEGIVTGKLRNATAQKFYEAVAKAFGATLVIVSDPTYASRYDGAKQQIIVNIQQNAPIHKLIAHELFHHIVNRADAAAYKAFVRAVKGMVGQERWDAARARFEPLDMGSALSSLTAEGDARLSEDMLADLFAEVFTQTGFYEMLSESVPGRTLAQRIIGRLLMLAQKIMGAFDGKSRWGYEETLLLGPSSMAEVHRLLGELISSMGKAQHQEMRYYGTFGLQRSDVQAKLSPLMQKIFPAGSSKRTAILDAIEKAAVWTVKQAKEATRWFMADVGAIKPAVKLATDLAYTAEREVQRFDAEVVSKHGDAFDDFVRQKIKTAQQKIRTAHAAGTLSAEEAQALTERFNANHIREILHDDFVRQPLSQEALQAKYPAAIHAAFADMQTWADAIAEQLKAIDPSFNPREHHYLQSIKWRHRNAEPFDDSFAAVLERSRLEGNKDFLKTKDTQRTTAEIREEGFEYRTVDPFEMARQYVRDAYQLIAYRKMIVDGQSMESGEGGKMIRAFATPEQAHRAGFRPVNDHATKLNMRLDLPIGYRIKLDKGYLQEGGVDQVYGSQEEAQRKADAYRKAFGEPASVEAVRGQHRVTEGPQWMLVAIDADGNRIESSQRFETMEQAQQRLASRSRYLADGTFVGDLGTHTKDGHRLVVEKERIAPEQVGVARLYFHPHLQRMIDRIIAPNPLLTGKVGKIGRKVMAVKNEMTMWEFAFSLFHGFTQAQELMADAATRAIQEKKGLAEWARSFNPVHAFRNAQKIASLLEYVAKHPEQAHDAAIQEEAQKLFGRPGVDLAELIAMNAMAGGLMEMDASVQAKTHAMGKMRYRSKPHMVTIQEGKVVYEAGEFGLAKGLPYATGSIKAVYDKMLLEEPNAQTKALFKAGRFALAEGSAAWLMQYAIPRIKMAVQAQSYLTALDQNRERLAAGLTTKQNLAYETMMFVEDKFGEYNWQNMWLNPSVKTLLQFTFRSFTWVLGNITGLGKSGYDFVQWGWINLVRGKYGKPDAYRLTDKGWWAINAFIGHMLTVSALCVIYQLALGLSGDDEAPEEEGVPMLTKLLFPRMDPNDPSYRVQFGSYVTETWKIFSHMGAFGNDMEPAKLFTGRLSSIIGQGVEAFYHGSDWRGTQIARSDDSLPVAFGKKLWHTLAIAPISVSSFMSQTQRKGFEPGQAIIAFLGMTDAPASAKRSAATNAAFALRRKENPGKPVDADAASLRDRVSRAARAHAKGDPKPLHDLVAQGEISPSKARKALERLPLIDNQPNPKYVTPLEQALKGLTLEGAMAVWEEMTADEQRRYRRLLIRKYGNAMSNKNKSRNDKERLKQRMQALKIL